MHLRSLAFRTDLALLERSGSQIEDRGTHLIVRTPDNPTFFWGNFLLLREHPVLGGEREVIGAFHTAFPDAEHVSIGIDVTDGHPDPQARDLQAWSDAGMEPDVATVLVATRLIQPLATIADVEIRLLESDEDWERRALLSWQLYPRTAKDTFLAFARAKNAQERSMVVAGAGVRFGAFAGDDLVSTAGVFCAEPGLARFQSVETHTEHRRQGIAANVIHRAGKHALEHLGAERLVIVAETEGEAIRIYQRLGFEATERQTMLERRPHAWRD